MGNCNLNCCNCIEKKDTQFITISNNHYSSNMIYKKRMIPIKTIEFSKLNSQRENNTYSLEEDEKYMSKQSNKYNEITQSNTNCKDTTIKCSILRKNLKNENIFKDLSNEYKISDNNTKRNNEENNEDFNKEKSIDVDEKCSNFISLRYYNTEFKRSILNIYLEHFNKKKDKNNKNGINESDALNRSNKFPLKYNYQKDKYISIFTDESK